MGRAFSICAGLAVLVATAVVSYQLGSSESDSGDGSMRADTRTAPATGAEARERAATKPAKPGGEPRRESRPPSRFSDAAIAACTRAREGRAPLERPRDPGDLGGYAARARPIAEQTLAALQLLKPPAGRRGESFSGLVTAYAALVAVYQRVEAAPRAQSAALGQLLPVVERRVSSQANAAGLPACRAPTALG